MPPTNRPVASQSISKTCTWAIAAFLGMLAPLSACATDGTDTDGSAGDPGAGGSSGSGTPSTDRADAGGPGTAHDASMPTTGHDAAATNDARADAGPLTASRCFANIGGDGGVKINYDQFNPKINSQCFGTNHQDIQGVEKLVFLGDSVTEGTPPNLPTQYYRTLLTLQMAAKFGITLEVKDCAVWGAQNDDFLGTSGKNEIGTCFPGGVEPKKTLFIWTMGGNDIGSWAKKQLSAADATIKADASVQQLRDAVTWLKSPTHFPNGSYVVFGNVYEYTDGTGDLSSCPTASLAGFSGNWFQGAPAVAHFQEQYMKVAVDTQSDMVFMLENFCGHGYHHDDPASQCYRGPNTPIWFDLTCIHPNPDGHKQLADMFAAVIDE